MHEGIPIMQWTSAHLAVFSAAELRAIGDTRYRDSPNRYSDYIYIAELSKEDMDFLFPDDSASSHHRKRSKRLSGNHGANLMQDTPVLKPDCC